MARTLIQGGWIVGFQNGHHAILRDGVVVYEDDRILHVGKSFAGAVDTVLPAAGKLVAPGFVNIHALTNIDIQTLVLDASEEGLSSSEDYAVYGAGAVEPQEEHLRAGALFSLLQLLKGGSTTVVEITTMAPWRFETPRREVPCLVEAAAQLGARLYVSHQFREGKRYRIPSGAWRYHWDAAAAREGLAYAREIVHRYEGTQCDRIRTMIFPYQLDACTPELLAEAKHAAQDLAVPIHLHAAQSLFEFHDCLRRHGKTPVQLLDSIGFLDEQTILTHLIYTTLHETSGFPRNDVSDLRIVAERGATVAHCPVVYARRNRILASFARYREQGINIGLGTDTFPQDMIEEMRWAALGCKWVDRDANRGTARDVFNAATLGGAQALGRSDIGRLAPGAKADIIVVDSHNLHTGPVDDPIKTLVYAASGGDVETVIVDGRTVLAGGKAPGIDEAALLCSVRAAHRAQRSQLAAQAPGGKPPDQLFPSSYAVLGASGEVQQ
jgi:cytosine/adenosine deaminase-related metal-dependent hydrolase